MNEDDLERRVWERYPHIIAGRDAERAWEMLRSKADDADDHLVLETDEVVCIAQALKSSLELIHGIREAAGSSKERDRGTPAKRVYDYLGLDIVAELRKELRAVAIANLIHVSRRLYPGKSLAQIK